MVIWVAVISRVDQLTKVMPNFWRAVYLYIHVYTNAWMNNIQLKMIKIYFTKFGSKHLIWNITKHLNRGMAIENWELSQCQPCRHWRPQAASEVVVMTTPDLEQNTRGRKLKLWTNYEPITETPYLAFTGELRIFLILWGKDTTW